MKTSSKKLLLILSVLVFIVCGYIREFTFYNINGQMHILYYKDDKARVSDKMKFLESYSYSQLNNLKWALTFLFAFLFLSLTLWTLKVLTGDKKFLFYAVCFYALLFGVSGIAMAIAWVHPAWSLPCYTFARFFMGVAQSPVPAMVLVPAFFLSQRLKEK